MAIIIESNILIQVDGLVNGLHHVSPSPIELPCVVAATSCTSVNAIHLRALMFQIVNIAQDGSSILMMPSSIVLECFIPRYC